MIKIKEFFNKLLLTKNSYHRADKFLIIIVGLIIIFGLVMLLSASSVVAYNSYQDSYYFFKHQLIGLSAGLLAFWFFSRFDYHRWKKMAFYLLIFSLILLLLVFIPGLAAGWGKAKSWIKVFGHSLQPAEIVKITFLIYLAAWLEARKNQLKNFSQGIGPFIIILGLVSLLMLLQPDFGTLFIIAITSLIVYFVAGGGLKHIFFILIIGLVALAIMINFKPYQANRFKCLVDPEFSKKEYCYQVNQSLIAIGSGGIFGRGLGASRQKFLYIPEVVGDSIFAVIGEETGWLFSSTLIILYLALFYRGMMIAKNATDNFGRILAAGIVSWLTIQALINIGGLINFIPLTGLPLPLISYGGTALMASLGAVGILVNISKQIRLK